MRLLRDLEGSILWLPQTSPGARRNLQREVQARGISPDRLVSAPYVIEDAEHLARLQLADLFLDTIPYNAHATASDALWAGVPVVTVAGANFPGRVAASLLHAIGMPDLIAASLKDYEQLALTLARNPDRLAGIRDELARKRRTYSLFDTASFTRGLETAYATMWDRWQRGLSPASFTVGHTA